MSREKDVTVLDWLQFVLNLIRVLLFAGMAIGAAVEFWINPHNNETLQAEMGHTYTLAGVVCEDKSHLYYVRFAPSPTDDEEAIFEYWLRDRPEKITSQTVYENQELQLPGCNDNAINAALVWSIDEEDGVHLRVHSGFEFDEPKE